MVPLPLVVVVEAVVAVVVELEVVEVFEEAEVGVAVRVESVPVGVPEGVPVGVPEAVPVGFAEAVPVGLAVVIAVAFGHTTGTFVVIGAVVVKVVVFPGPSDTAVASSARSFNTSATSMFCLLDVLSCFLLW